MKSILTPKCPADLYPYEKRADLFIRAGQFAVAVEKVMSEHFAVSASQEGSPFDDRTLDGLMGGLKVIGELMLDEGDRAKRELEQFERRV